MEYKQKTFSNDVLICFRNAMTLYQTCSPTILSEEAVTDRIKVFVSDCLKVLKKQCDDDCLSNIVYIGTKVTSEYNVVGTS